jgi:hypothetical protein
VEGVRDGQQRQDALRATEGRGSWWARLGSCVARGGVRIQCGARLAERRRLPCRPWLRRRWGGRGLRARRREGQKAEGGRFANSGRPVERRPQDSLRRRPGYLR